MIDISVLRLHALPSHPIALVLPALDAVIPVLPREPSSSFPAWQPREARNPGSPSSVAVGDSSVACISAESSATTRVCSNIAC